jgi:cephalosporin-C deacetylase
VAHFDLSGEALRQYRSASREPAGFDAFWAGTLKATAEFPLDATFTPHPTGLRLVETFDVRFRGWGGQPVKAWLSVPAGARPVAAVVEYIGYNGGRGLPHEALLYAAAGWAHLRMDTRGQGTGWTGGWSVGDTPDLGGADTEGAGGPAQPGFMTRGILDPEGYYYRRVYADAVRAVEAVRAHPAVDPARVAVTGASQGGGLTAAVGGLVPDLAAVAPDVPFLCDFRRSTGLVDSDPYGEIVRYLKGHREDVEQVFHTLDHVDAVHHAARGRAPSLWSTALMDEVCPPSSVYAAYNAWPGPKRMVEYPYNGHEGGGPYHDAERLAFLREHLGD